MAGMAGRNIELREASEKSPLLSALHDPQREQERRQRQALLQGSDTLNRGLSRLEQGHRTLAETEALGNDVLLNLQKQRQQLRSAQSTLSETDEELGASDKTLRNMYFQSLLSSGLSYLLCGVVLVSILLVAYAKLRSYGMFMHPPPPPPPHSPPPPLLVLLRAPRPVLPKLPTPEVPLAPTAAPVTAPTAVGG